MKKLTIAREEAKDTCMNSVRIQQTRALALTPPRPVRKGKLKSFGTTVAGRGARRTVNKVLEQ